MQARAAEASRGARPFLPAFVGAQLGTVRMNNGPGPRSWGLGLLKQAQHPVPNFGCPKLRAALDGATVHWGQAVHCAGPSNEEPARATIYGQNG